MSETVSDYRRCKSAGRSFDLPAQSCFSRRWLSLPAEPLFPPMLAVHVIAVPLPEPGLVSGMNSMPRIHLALFQK